MSQRARHRSLRRQGRAAETRHPDRARREPRAADHRQALSRRPGGDQQGRDAGACRPRPRVPPAMSRSSASPASSRARSGSFVLQHSATMTRGDAGRQHQRGAGFCHRRAARPVGQDDHQRGQPTAPTAYEFDFRLEAREQAERARASGGGLARAGRRAAGAHVARDAGWPTSTP